MSQDFNLCWQCPVICSSAIYKYIAQGHSVCVCGCIGGKDVNCVEKKISTCIGTQTHSSLKG